MRESNNNTEAIHNLYSQEKLLLVRLCQLKVAECKCSFEVPGYELCDPQHGVAISDGLQATGCLLAPAS